jgi:hypothetical protein
MRHLTIRLQLLWLTLAALAAFAMVATIRPEGGVAAAEFARNAEEFRQALRPDASIATLNLLRAHLAADMVFLLAYGLLLRQSVRYLGPHPFSRLAQHGAVLVMVADATENLCALRVLRSLAEEQLQLSPALFTTMNAAAFVKWAAAGGVMVFLAMRWRVLAPSLKGGRRYVGAAIGLLFAAGALGSLIVAASVFSAVGRDAAAAVALVSPAIAFTLQLRLLDLVGVALRFAYLVRVPLGVLLVTAVFGPLALGPAAPLLGGVLDVPTTLGIGVVTTSSIVLAFACATEISLVRSYAWQRMFDRTLRVLRHRVLGRAVFWTALVSVSSLLFSVSLASLRVTAWQIAGGLIGGTLIALLFLFVVEWLSARFSIDTTEHSAPQLAVPFNRLTRLGSRLREVRAAEPPAPVAAVKRTVRQWSLAGKLFGLSSGYLEVSATGDRRLLPGHTFAAIQFCMTLVLYVVLLYGKAPGREVSVEDELWVPTAGSLVLLLLLSSWLLAGVAFFVDRYRIPLFTVVLAGALVTGSLTRTDYIVRTTAEGQQEYPLVTPGQVLAAFPAPLIIAAAGGGIQAGAWTARVLEGIDDKLGGALGDRTALISAVSGGSMGGLYYGAFRDTSLSEATRMSMEPSLDEIASALIGTELLRVLGLSVGTDRGEALERSWTLRLPAGSDAVTLRSWADQVRRFALGEPSARAFPAFLFNTTIVETGQPMAFTTTQFPTEAYRETFAGAVNRRPVAESAHRMFNLSADGRSARDVGLHVATAARLSAAFPYVSPAATLDIPGSPSYHLVDGGYYDNYGLAALAQWLDDALHELPAPPAEVGVVIIRGLVESSSNLDQELRQENTSAVNAEVPNRGWAWQLIAPPSAFLKTRSFGQWAGGTQVLKLLIEKWRAQNVVIRPYLFDFPADALPQVCAVAPLSWKLSAPQQRCIEDGWTHLAASQHDLWSPALGATP